MARALTSSGSSSSLLDVEEKRESPYHDNCDVLEYYNARINSVTTEYSLPAVLRTRTYVQKPACMGRVSLNRRSIMLRDKHACQYCGSGDDLTLDHVVPASKGGGFTWDNIVTCCARCNMAKGSRMLKDLQWSLRCGTPREPKTQELGLLLASTPRGQDSRTIPAEWEAYMLHLMKQGDGLQVVRSQTTH